MKCSVVHLVDAYLVVHEQQYVKVDPNLYIREDLVSCAEDLLTLIGMFVIAEELSHPNL